MSYGTQGAVTPTQVQGLVPNHVFGIATNWFANRTPLFSRLPKVPDGNPVFKMVGHSYRPRTTTLGATVADGSTTTITLADASSFMTGDVLKLNSGEYVEITADPNTSNNQIAVRRGIGGTAAAGQTNGTTVLLVGNSRTGAEKNQNTIAASGSAKTQYMQTIQHPYSIGGGVQSNGAFPLVPGAATPLDQYRMDAMQNWADDAEMSAVFGVAEDNGQGAGRAKMGGLLNLITTNAAASPADAAAYKATSFQRDLLTAPRKKGGQPNVVIVSSNWMDAFSVWGHPLQLLDAGETVFGTPISVYAAPFLGDVELWEASLLPDFTAFSLTLAEARWRVKRPLVDEPLAKVGDTYDGQMIGELAIELDNEAHHASVQGVTAFSA